MIKVLRQCPPLYRLRMMKECDCYYQWYVKAMGKGLRIRVGCVAEENTSVVEVMPIFGKMLQISVWAGEQVGWKSMIDETVISVPDVTDQVAMDAHIKEWMELIVQLVDGD